MLIFPAIQLTVTHLRGFVAAFALVAFARRPIRFATAPVSVAADGGCGGVMGVTAIGGGALRGSIAAGAVVPLYSDEDRS